MKKLTSLVLATGMVLSLAACGGSGSSTAASTTNTDGSTATTDTAAAVDGSVSRYGKAGMFCAGRKRNRTFHGTWRGIPPHCGGGDESPAL